MREATQSTVERHARNFKWTDTFITTHMAVVKLNPKPKSQTLKPLSHRLQAENLGAGSIQHLFFGRTDMPSCATMNPSEVDMPARYT